MQHTKSDGAEQKGNHLPVVYNVKKKLNKNHKNKSIKTGRNTKRTPTHTNRGRCVCVAQSELSGFPPLFIYRICLSFSEWVWSLAHLFSIHSIS